MTPVRTRKSLSALIRSHERIAPLFPLEILRTPPLRFDFSKTNPAIQHVDMNVVGDLKKVVESELRKAKRSWGFGGWGEDRFFYKSSDLFKDGDGYRTVHLGIDIWLPPGTPLYAPIPGRVHSFQNNQNFLDYGPTVITEHIIQDTPFYILYGHLSTESLSRLSEGKILESGDRVAKIGTEQENGSWPSHVHLELITDIQDKKGDFVGTAKPSQKKEYLDLCPDPEVLLERFMF